MSTGALLRLAWLVLALALLPYSASAQQALGMGQGQQMQGMPPGSMGVGSGFGSPSQMSNPGMQGGGSGFNSAGFGGGFGGSSFGGGPPNGSSGSNWMPGAPPFQGNGGFNFGGAANGPFGGGFGGPSAGVFAFGNSMQTATMRGAQQASFEAMTQFMQTALDPFAGGRNVRSTAPQAAADERGDASRTTAPPWTVWATGFGESQTASVASGGTTSSGVYGTMVGADFALSERTTVGFAAAGGGTYFNSGSSGSGRSDLFQAGGFVRHMIGDGYVSGALAYGWQNIDAYASTDRLNPISDAAAYSSRAEAGYRFALPWMGIAPYAAAQVTDFQLATNTTQALANRFGSTASPNSMTDSRSELGFRTDRSFGLQNSTLTLRSRLAWVHDFNPENSMAAQLQRTPSFGFALDGITQAPDATLAAATAELRFATGWLAALTFEGEFSNAAQSYAGKGFVRYVW